jgi:hypothetical protein
MRERIVYHGWVLSKRLNAALGGDPSMPLSARCHIEQRQPYVAIRAFLNLIHRDHTEYSLRHWQATKDWV